MFEINNLILILGTIIVTISAVKILSILKEAKKNNTNLGTTEAWLKIRPIVSEGLIEAIKIYQANEIGYEGLVDYTVQYIKKQIDNSDLLITEEKALITEDLIRTVLEPQLKKIYNSKKISIPLP